jgi:hypothetical protein
LADYATPARHFEPKPAALDWWADTYRAEVFRRQDEHAASARLGDQAWQLAAVYAFTDNGRHVIDLDDIKRGWALADWLDGVRLSLVKDIGRSDRAKLLDRLEAIVADHPAGITTGKARAMLSQPQRNNADALGGAGKLLQQLADDERVTPRGGRWYPPGGETP